MKVVRQLKNRGNAKFGLKRFWVILMQDWTGPRQMTSGQDLFCFPACDKRMTLRASNGFEKMSTNLLCTCALALNSEQSRSYDADAKINLKWQS